MITDGNGAEGLSFDQDKSLIIIIIIIIIRFYMINISFDFLSTIY